MEKSVRLFTIYAMEDEAYVEQLTTNLSLLRRKNVITDYYDQYYTAIDLWDKRTQFNFSDANYVLLLLSPALIQSGCLNDPHLLSSTSTIVPILIRNCDFQTLPLLDDKPIIPSNGQPVESVLWRDRSNAWRQVTEELRLLITGGRAGEEPVLIPAAAAVAPAFVPAPVPAAKGMAWPVKLLFSLMALGAMGTVTYYLVNYKPSNDQIVQAPIPAADSNAAAPVIEPTPAEPEPVVSTATEKSAPAKTQSAPKRGTGKKSTVKPNKTDVTKVTVVEEVKQPEPPPPPPKAPAIKSADFEQMLFNFSQGTVAESDFAPLLCNRLETMVRYGKKNMTFHQMCEEIKDVKAKKVKKITVLSAAYENGCISSMEVTLKKKGLFN